jgi:DNA topoisomerase-2
LIDALEKELVLLSNKARYIKENLDGTIDLRKKKKEQVLEMLQSKDYDIIDDDSDYKYLTKMPMDSVTEENVEKLLTEKGNKETELNVIKGTSINQMWNSELDNLLEQYLEYKEVRQRLMDGEETKLKKKKVTSKGTVVKKPTKNLIVLEE